MSEPIYDMTQWPDHVEPYLAEAAEMYAEAIGNGSLCGRLCVYVSRSENIRAWLSFNRDGDGRLSPLFYEAGTFYPELSEEEDQ
ncbi:hypothetical protein [Rhodococcus qingshengii]|uniref:hypothetical protein n=1 Tax=Rhodococcus qingshengii TaxID=334542 RepID=UPI0035DC1626